MKDICRLAISRRRQNSLAPDGQIDKTLWKSYRSISFASNISEMVHTSILSRGSHTFLRKTIKAGSIIQCLPFKWNDDLKRVDRKGRWSLLGLQANFLASLSVPSYLICKLTLWHMSKGSSSDMRSTMVMIFALIMFLFGSVSKYHILKHREDHYKFLQTSLNFFAAIPGTCLWRYLVCLTFRRKLSFVLLQMIMAWLCHWRLKMAVKNTWEVFILDSGSLF